MLCLVSPRILAKWKTIRDLAPQPADEEAGISWDAANNLRELVKEIQELIGGGCEIPELEDCLSGCIELC